MFIKYLISTLAVVLVSTVLLFSRSSAKQDGTFKVLTYSPALKIFASVLFIGVSFGVGLIYANYYAASDWEAIGALSLLLVPGLVITALGVFETFYTEIKYDDDGIHQRHFLSKTKHLPFDQVKSVGWSDFFKSFQIKGGAKSKVTVSQYMSGMEELLAEVEGHGIKVPNPNDPNG